MYKIIGRILSRKNIHSKVFDENMLRSLGNMTDAVESAYDAMIENLSSAHGGSLEEISNAYNAEDRINSVRNYLRDNEIENIESGRTNYQTSVYYMDIIGELERMGDYMINISQTLERTFRVLR